jgi:predicted ATPase
MRLYAQAGQQSAALRQYEVCARLLEKELDVEPEAETQALYAAIRTRQVSATPAPAATPLSSTSSTESPSARLFAAAPAQPPPHNLPAPTSSFIGRERNLNEIAQRIADPTCRLLTLVGPGGIGKTQLAIRAAQMLVHEMAGAAEFADGVFFVSLVSITNADLVLSTIAHTLKIPDQGSQSPFASLSAFLRDKRMLLILDNVEQVIAAAPQIVTLLEAAEHLTLLLTSREALRVRGEFVYHVPPLTGPDASRITDLSAAMGAEAIRLFVDRARAVRSDFALTADNLQPVIEICRRLDGLPLAIELAAARIRLLPPQALLNRLERRLPLLTSSGPDRAERHRTLRSAIAWSYQLLEPEEQRLFRRLAVFVGGATIEAIEAVCADESASVSAPSILDLLDSLLAKSLLIQDEHDGAPRLRMLATIHEYAEELLTVDGEHEAIILRHTSYFTAWAEQAHSELYGSSQVQWRTRLDREHDNLRAVLQRAQVRGDATTLLRVAGALGRFWGLQGYVREGRAWLETALTFDLQRISSDTRNLTMTWRAQALLTMGHLCWRQSDLARAREVFTESLALFQALHNQHGIAQALNGLGVTALQAGELQHAQIHFSESLALFRESGDQERIATLLNNLAIATQELGDLAQARAVYRESLALQRELRNVEGAALTLHNLGTIDFYQGLMASARPFFEESLALRRQLSSLGGVAGTLFHLGVIAAYEGDSATARAQLQESLELAQATGTHAFIIEALEGWAYLAAQLGRHQRAVQLFSAAMKLRTQYNALHEAEYAPIRLMRSQLRRQMGIAAWEQAWHEGQQSDWQALIAALQDELDRPDTPQSTDDTLPFQALPLVRREQELFVVKRSSPRRRSA